MKLVTDRELVEIFLDPVRLCLNFKPAFGTADGEGVTLNQFQVMYGADPLYAWLGLDDPAVYAAHKASGAITSVYRQVGVGSERLVRQIIGSQLALSDEQMQWSYEYVKERGANGIHTLDACVRFKDVQDRGARKSLEKWLDQALASMNLRTPVTSERFEGVVFEIRQGYKSADSKRQAADLRFGSRAYTEGLLPVIMVLSTQVSSTVMRRYHLDNLLILKGTRTPDPTTSTFAFFNDAVGWDLAAFFERNQSALKEVQRIVRQLLKP